MPRSTRRRQDLVAPTKNRPTVLRFSKKELNTVLAALRCFQQGGNEMLVAWEGRFEELVDDVKDIDALCERINMGG